MFNKAFSYYEPFTDEEGKQVLTFFVVIASIANFLYGLIAESVLGFVAAALLLVALYYLRKYGWTDERE